MEVYRQKPRGKDNWHDSDIEKFESDILHSMILIIVRLPMLTTFSVIKKKELPPVTV